MKTFLLSACFLLASFFVQAQTYPSTCTPSGNMADIFRNDAYRLATKRVYDINSTWKDSVNIPEVSIDSIARALYAIKNMEYSPLKDTIITLFGTSNFVPYFFGLDSSHTNNAGGDWNYAYWLKRIYMKAYGDASPEALDSINNLLNVYNLSQGTGYEWVSDHAINIPALTKQFEAISGVQFAEKIGYIGSGNNIGATIVNGDVLLTYSLGCGDCPLGCTYGRTWNFKVHISSDCSVEFLSAYNWGLIVMLPDLELCFPVIVPVEFKSIRASQKSNYQLVEWQMAMEDNVSGYVVERSTDGANYIAIGQIDIIQNSSVPVNYSWKDPDLLNGNVYYRIRIVERSGAKKYSPIALLNVKSKTAIRIFPTLVRNNIINIQFNKVDKGVYFVDLLNASGQKLFSTEINVNTESFTQQLQIPGMISAGMYFISVRGKTMLPNQLIYISK